MSVEDYEALPTSETREKSIEETQLQSVITLGLKEQTEEVQAQRNRASEKTDGRARRFDKPKNDEDPAEAAMTSKCSSGKAEIIVPRLAERNSRQAVASGNQIQPDIRLAEKNNEEIEDNNGGKKMVLMKKRIIYASDCIVSATIVGPLVIAHWRGIWVLMDFYEHIFSGWLCFVVGLCLHLLFSVSKDALHRTFAMNVKSKSLCARLGCRLVRTLYTYVFSFACNCHWRGAWVILNDCFGLNPGTIACFSAAVLGDLLILRCTRNLLAPPYIVILDSPKFVFRFPTKYKSSLAQPEEPLRAQCDGSERADDST